MTPFVKLTWFCCDCQEWILSDDFTFSEQFGKPSTGSTITKKDFTNWYSRWQSYAVIVPLVHSSCWNWLTFKGPSEKVFEKHKKSLDVWISELWSGMPCHLNRHSRPLLPKNPRPLIWPWEDKLNLLWADHSCVTMKGQFVRVVTLNCSPQHPEAFIPLTPPPKKLPRWPSPCIHVPALPWGYSSLPFQLPHSTLRQERARCALLCERLFEDCPCLHACLHMCIFLYSDVCGVCVFAISEKALKGKMWRGQ